MSVPLIMFILISLYCRGVFSHPGNFRRLRLIDNERLQNKLANYRFILLSSIFRGEAAKVFFCFSIKTEYEWVGCLPQTLPQSVGVFCMTNFTSLSLINIQLPEIKEIEQKPSFYLRITAYVNFQ